MTVDAGLRQIFRERLPRFDWCTVEMGVTSRGVPDSNYCCEGVEGWIECKQAKHWRTVIRPEQIGWAERRIDHGGKVFCAVRRARDELWLYHGSQMRYLLKQRLDECLTLGHWEGGPAAWNWHRISQTLTSYRP